jgi:hypothetical protein
VIVGWTIKSNDRINADFVLTFGLFILKISPKEVLLFKVMNNKRQFLFCGRKPHIYFEIANVFFKRLWY